MLQILYSNISFTFGPALATNDDDVDDSDDDEVTNVAFSYNIGFHLAWDGG